MATLYDEGFALEVESAMGTPMRVAGGRDIKRP